MRRSRGRITLYLIFVATLLHCVTGSRINATIYDTDISHVTYAPKANFCTRWVNRLFWRTCEFWASPWKSEVYRIRGKLATVHRSLDHQDPSVTIQFQGSAIWIYGPPRSQLPAMPGDYKICLYENHRLSYESVCYRVDVAEAYSATKDFDSPVAIFAKGGLQYHEHRVVISVGDPTNNIRDYHGIQFSHAVYTVERPTPWPVEEDKWRFREVVMHDTHPLLLYFGNPSCTWWSWCRPGADSGWKAKTYRAEDGSTVSWHELRSRDEQDRNRWGLDATITAGAVVLYGIPKAHISNVNYLSQVCVRIDAGPCEVVDVQHAYLGTKHLHESVMLWRNDALDPSRKTRISVRLVQTSSSSTSVFPFKAIHYYEQQEYSSPNPSVGHLSNVSINHDSEDVIYHPERRCVSWFLWWCTEWFDPWALKEVGPSEDRLTYRSTVAWYRATEDPAITMSFQGSAVYVYGAPKSFIKAPHAPQHVCINDVCQVVDLEQAYLNAPLGYSESTGIRGLNESGTDFAERNNITATHNTTTLSTLHPELDPILIWSTSGLDDKIQHTLRLALASLPSEGNAEMTVAKVVYTSIHYGWGETRPDVPVPQPDRSYEGPLYPPHATKWAPRVPRPPVSPPPQTPSPVPQNPPRPHQPDNQPLAVFLWIISAVFVLFVLCVLILLGGEHHDPRAEVLPTARPPTPPPRYEPRSPSRFSARPVQPLLRPQHDITFTRDYNTFSNADATSPPKHTDTRSYPTNQTITRSSQDKPTSTTRCSPASLDPSPSSSQPGKLDSKQQNNLGPCPGSSVPPSKPAYDETTPTQAGPRVPRRTPATSNPSTTSTVPSYAPTNSSNSTTHTSTDHASAPAISRNIADAVPNYSSIASSQTSARPLSSNSTSQSAQSTQPPPLPQSPPPPQYATLITAKTTSSPEPIAQVNQTRSSPQVAQLVSAPDRVIPNASGPEQRTPASQHTTSTQTRQQSVLPALQVDPQPPRPRQEVRAYTPALAEWAASQGYRLDGLVDAAARRAQAPLRPRSRDQAGQTQRPSSSSEAMRDRPTRGVPPRPAQPARRAYHNDTDWHRGPGATGTAPPNRGVIPNDPSNSQRNGQSRAPQGSSISGAAITSGQNQNDWRAGNRGEVNNGARGGAGGRGGRGRGGRGGHGGRRRNGRGQGQQDRQN